jgi:hypothetical protein
MTVPDATDDPSPLAADAELDRIPELLGEMERLRAVPLARLGC